MLTINRINRLPFDTHCYHGTAIKHSVSDRVKRVICNFWQPGTLTLRAERQSAQRQSARIPNSYKWRLNPIWQRMLYSCTHGNGGRQRVKLNTAPRLTCNVLLLSTYADTYEETGDQSNDDQSFNHSHNHDYHGETESTAVACCSIGRSGHRFPCMSTYTIP